MASNNNLNTSFFLEHQALKLPPIRSARVRALADIRMFEFLFEITDLLKKTLGKLIPETVAKIYEF